MSEADSETTETKSLPNTRFGLRSMFWSVWIVSTLLATLSAASNANNGIVSVSNVMTAVAAPIFFGISVGMAARGNFAYMIIGWLIAMTGYAVIAWS